MKTFSLIATALVAYKTTCAAPAVERRAAPNPRGVTMYTTDTAGLMIEDSNVNFVQAKFNVPAISATGKSPTGRYSGRFTVNIDSPSKMVFGSPNAAQPAPQGSSYVQFGLEYGIGSTGVSYAAFWCTPTACGDLIDASGQPLVSFAPGDPIDMSIYLWNATAASIFIINPRSTSGTNNTSRLIPLSGPLQRSTASWTIIDRHTTNAPLPKFSDFLVDAQWSNTANNISNNASPPTSGQFANIYELEEGDAVAKGMYNLNAKKLMVTHT